MSTQLHVHALLWKYDHKSDKIWGVIEAGDNLYTVWGKRLARLQFKAFGSVSLSKLASLKREEERKIKTGYKPLSEVDIGSLISEISLRQQLVNSKLLDKVR